MNNDKRFRFVAVVEGRCRTSSKYNNEYLVLKNVYDMDKQKTVASSAAICISDRKDSNRFEESGKYLLFGEGHIIEKPFTYLMSNRSNQKFNTNYRMKYCSNLEVAFYDENGMITGKLLDRVGLGFLVSSPCI